jgi:hypothetical protein
VRVSFRALNCLSQSKAFDKFPQLRSRDVVQANARTGVVLHEPAGCQLLGVWPNPPVTTIHAPARPTKSSRIVNCSRIAMMQAVGLKLHRRWTMNSLSQLNVGDVGTYKSLQSVMRRWYQRLVA